MNEMIQQKVNEMAHEYARILENECQKACDRFNVKADQLIIEYHSHAEIKIKVQACHFQINNNFVFENGLIREFQVEKENE